MPYLEILASPAPAARKRTAVQALTRSLVEHFGVSPQTVTVFFVATREDDYAHAGQLGETTVGQRVFAKLHAYPRHLTQRRAVVAAMTPVLAACFCTSPANVAIYFLDRARDEVAHGGTLVCDEPLTCPVTP
ncbi:hypothetical protein FOZ76_24420 [Verticiella sediminum]|uniref:4-oxalocrotonate tautomerase n=1 Tax=Verticiella sediminum TaxID=1247510 RepID=A0A556A7D6_9BURK|nr:hypothetical protein [Verticiella sediminum]TSH88793.1 hypothetical protein FOZ76_24420 [Verticiella sediminum]